MKKYSLLFVVAALAVLSPATGLTQTNNPAQFGLSPELKSFLKDADSFTLFSIELGPDFEHKSTNTFQNYAVLGQLKIRRAETRDKLIEALDEGIAADEKSHPPGSLFLLPNCFNPRHGIRAAKGDKIVEFLICFECAQIQVSSNKGKGWSFGTTKDPAVVFNGVLKKNKVPLPKD